MAASGGGGDSQVCEDGSRRHREEQEVRGAAAGLEGTTRAVRAAMVEGERHECAGVVPPFEEERRDHLNIKHPLPQFEDRHALRAFDRPCHPGRGSASTQQRLPPTDQELVGTRGRQQL
eukprot:762604-Hanusia_phi.AAC.2